MSNIRLPNGRNASATRNKTLTRRRVFGNASQNPSCQQPWPLHQRRCRLGSSPNAENATKDSLSPNPPK